MRTESSSAVLSRPTALIVAAIMGVAGAVIAAEGDASAAPVAAEQTAVEFVGEAAGSADSAAAAEQPRPISRARGAVELLREYVRIDTTNPPGNESAGARFLAALLESEGVVARVLEPEAAPGRGSVYARLEGRSDEAIVLLSHIDVVPADAAAWDHPPLGADLADGVLHGRGVLDCKGPGIVQALAFLELASREQPPAHDVILLASAGEETGGAIGAGWLLEEHPELFEGAKYVLNEGGFIHREPGKPLLYNLNAAEKGPCWFRIRAVGEPGHGSRPAEETAVTRLVRAVESLVNDQRPHEVGPVVAGYFAAYAGVEEDRARQLRQLARSLEEPEFYEWFTARPSWSAMIHDTVAPTVLQGGVKTNVIPAVASAEVDARLLPGHSCDEFLENVERLIGTEHVSVEPLAVAFPPSQSPLDNELTHAIERLAASEEDAPAVVLPGLLTGFTDSHYFREKGIAAYGFVPLVVEPEQRKTVHGPNERVTAVEIERAVDRLVRLFELMDD